MWLVLMFVNSTFRIYSDLDSGFKELDFLFRDITENLGYQIITDKIYLL